MSRWCVVGLIVMGCSSAPQPDTPQLEPPRTEPCPPRDRPPNSCSDDKQCPYGCAAPVDVPPLYGDCTCPSGQVCTSRWTGIGRNDRCEADCTTTGCRDGFRCAASGRCEIVSCTDGYACKARARCEPGTAGADLHGCLHRACKADRDCACGAFCVLGQCHAKPGTCREPPMG